MEMLPPAVSSGSLVMPVAAAQESDALGAEPTDASLDFAALLAAGLAPQPLLPQAAGADADKAPADERDPTQALAAPDTAAPLPSAAQLDLFASQLPLPATQAAPMPAAPGDATRLAPADPASAGKSTATPLGRPAAVAAQAAGIAADAARDEAHAAAFDGAAKPALEAAAADIAAHALPVHADSALHAERDAIRALDARAAESEPHPTALSALALSGVEQRAPAEPTAVREVAAPVQSSDFADAFSQQVLWMADKDAQVAELHLHPPELGPVEVRLTISGGEASAQFVSPYAEVRSAIESSLVRLRESFAEAGIALGEASVSAESFRDPSGATHSDARQTPAGYGDAQLGSGRITDALTGRPIRRGLVDLFA